MVWFLFVLCFNVFGEKTRMPSCLYFFRLFSIVVLGSGLNFVFLFSFVLPPLLSYSFFPSSSFHSFPSLFPPPLRIFCLFSASCGMCMLLRVNENSREKKKKHKIKDGKPRIKPKQFRNPNHRPKQSNFRQRSFKSLLQLTRIHRRRRLRLCRQSQKNF